jgi:putative addiction module component (TIGR02574 family)
VLSPQAQNVLDAILALGRSERIWIIERIEASLEGDGSAELTAEQIAMLRRRSDEVRQGKVVPIPADEALRMLREKRQP